MTFVIITFMGFLAYFNVQFAANNITLYHILVYKLKTNKLIAVTVQPFLVLLQHLHTGSPLQSTAVTVCTNMLFNIRNSCIFAIQSTYGFQIVLRRNSNYFPKQQRNVATSYSLRDTNSEYIVHSILLGILHEVCGRKQEIKLTKLRSCIFMCLTKLG
jgi:hypothetical protein